MESTCPQSRPSTQCRSLRLNVKISMPASTFQSFVVPSIAPVAMVRPSGETASERIKEVGPKKRVSCSPVATSQENSSCVNCCALNSPPNAFPSYFPPPENRVRPSGENWTVTTAACPANVRIKRDDAPCGSRVEAFLSFFGTGSGVVSLRQRSLDQCSSACVERSRGEDGFEGDSSCGIGRSRAESSALDDISGRLDV